MPTVNFVKLWKSVKANDYSDHSRDPSGRAQTTINKQFTYMVQFDGFIEDGVQVAGNADAITAGLPELGKAYSGLLCVGLRPQRTSENPFIWRVDTNFSTIQDQSSAGQSAWNLNLHRGTAAREVNRTHDRLGKPLCNTFADILPQIPNATLYDNVYEFSWSTALAPTAAFEELEGKINGDEFSFNICGIHRTFTKSQAKCTRAGFSVTKVITSTSGSTPTNTFLYNVEFAIQVRKPKWVWTAPNEGWRGYVAEDGTIDTFRDNGNEPVNSSSTPRTSPTKMDLNGFELADGAQVLLLPDDAIGRSTPAAGRTYDDDGAFELEDLAEFGWVFAPLHD